MRGLRTVINSKEYNQISIKFINGDVYLYAKKTDGSARQVFKLEKIEGIDKSKVDVGKEGFEGYDRFQRMGKSSEWAEQGGLVKDYINSGKGPQMILDDTMPEWQIFMNGL